MTRRQSITWGAGIFLLALTAAGLGIRNDFTYDDRFIIQGNTVLHLLGRNWWRFFLQSYWPLDAGGDGYRPLTILLFSVEWAVGDGAPWVFHAVNILAYAATSVAVFWLGLAILPWTAAVILAALFAVHPVHVEAVANVVGQSELWVALGTICATGVYIRRRNAGTFDWRAAAGIAALYVGTFLCKENGIVLPAILLVAELTVVRDDRPIRQRLVALRPFGLALVALAVAYLWVRTQVLGGRVGGFESYVPFEALHVSAAQRVLTMIGLVPQWVRLFVWPARLSAEYGPPQYPIALGPELTQLPGCLLLVGTLSLGVALRRQLPVTAFGIAWMTVTLLPVSNFILTSGVLIAERTLFMPSLGALLVIVGLLPYVEAMLTTPVARVVALAGFQGLLILGAVRSATRTLVWRNNDTLFAHEVVDAPYVYRTHYMLGGWDFLKDQLRTGESEFRIAMHLFPQDPFVPYNLAYEYKKRGLFAPALAMYEQSLRLAPNFRDATANVAICLAAQNRFAEAREPAMRALHDGTGDPKVMRTIIEIAAAQIRTGKAGPHASKAADASGKVPGVVQKASGS